MAITTSIVFDHRGRTGLDDSGPVEIRITHMRKHYYINTGVRVKKRNFAFGTVINERNSVELNEQLVIILRKVTEEVNRCINNNEPIDVAAIRQRVWQVGVTNAKGETPFLDWIRKEITLLDHREGTLRHYATTLKRLEAFGGMKRWQDVNSENIYAFDAFLHSITKKQSDAERKEKKPVERICQSTVYNRHKDLKALLYRAVRQGIIEQNPYERLRGQFKRGDKENTEYLTEQEMNAIVSLKPVEGSRMAIARDLCVIQMYTGLAYSDLMAFDIKDYKKVDGEYVHVGERVKTSTKFVNQLLPPVVEVLEKYNWQVPHMNNKEYNIALKMIGQVAGVRFPLHSHALRHSFATWALKNDVPIQIVSKMLGHKSISVTQRYAKVLAEDVTKEFFRLKNNLNKKNHEENNVNDGGIHNDDDRMCERQ